MRTKYREQIRYQYKLELCYSKNYAFLTNLPAQQELDRHQNIQQNDIKQNDIKQNDIKQNDIQQNEIWRNDI